MPKLEKVSSARVPSLGLPYIQAVRYGELVFVSGQVAIGTSSLAAVRDVRAQTLTVLRNIADILTDAGTSIELGLEAICFLRSQEDFESFNNAYGEFFRGAGPPRTTVVAAVPLDPYLVEIRMIAGVPNLQGHAATDP